jgi:hypothetical protein
MISVKMASFTDMKKSHTWSIGDEVHSAGTTGGTPFVRTSETVSIGTPSVDEARKMITAGLTTHRLPQEPTVKGREKGD